MIWGGSFRKSRLLGKLEHGGFYNRSRRKSVLQILKYLADMQFSDKQKVVQRR